MKIGLKTIRFWDGDLIEEHNIPNQAFLPEQIGENKAEALRKMVSWMKPDARNEFYTGQEPLHEVVFLLVDSMEERKKIFEKNIRLKNVELMIETRMGSNMGIIYCIDPRNANDIRYWESKWYPDDKAEVSACGNSISVGPTADILAGYAAWAYMNWELNEHKIQDREMMFTTQEDLMILTERAA